MRSLVKTAFETPQTPQAPDYEKSAHTLRLPYTAIFAVFQAHAALNSFQKNGKARGKLSDAFDYFSARAGHWRE